MSAVTHILQHLSPRERAAAALVCKEWAHAAEHPALWHTIDLSGKQDAGDALRSLLKSRMARQHVRHVKLEFAVGVDDGLLQLLEGCSLTSLNLNACQKVTDAGVSALLRGSPGLRSLSLYWNLNVGDASLATAAASCPQLEVLNLSGCKRVTDEGVAAIAAACPNLVDLDLTRCVEVTDDGVEAVAAGCPKLRVVRLYADSGITDVGVKALSRLPLEVLDLTGGNAVSAVGIASLAGCRELRSLALTWCIRINDAGVVALAAGCRKLQLLSLHGLRLVSDRSVEALAEHCADTLRTLDVNGCTGIERRDRSRLQSLFPRVKTWVVHT